MKKERRILIGGKRKENELKMDKARNNMIGWFGNGGGIWKKRGKLGPMCKIRKAGAKFELAKEEENRNTKKKKKR